MKNPPFKKLHVAISNSKFKQCVRQAIIICLAYFAVCGALDVNAQGFQRFTNNHTGFAPNNAALAASTWQQSAANVASRTFDPRATAPNGYVPNAAGTNGFFNSNGAANQIPFAVQPAPVPQNGFRERYDLTLDKTFPPKPDDPPKPESKPKPKPEVAGSPTWMQEIPVVEIQNSFAAQPVKSPPTSSIASQATPPVSQTQFPSRYDLTLKNPYPPKPGALTKPNALPNALANSEEQAKSASPLYGEIGLTSYQDSSDFVFEVQDSENPDSVWTTEFQPMSEIEIQNEVKQLRQLVDLQQQQLETIFGMTDRMSREIAPGISGDPNAFRRQLTPENIAGLQRMEQRLNSRLNQLSAINQGSLQQLHADTNELKYNIGQYLPNNLRELYSHSRPLLSPLAIFNTLQFDTFDFDDSDRNFASPIWRPIFLWDYTDQFQVEINPLIESDRIELLTAQVNWFVNDNLTLVGGRFASPIGFFNDRLRTPWVFKTPDQPLLFEQVLPGLLSFRGGQSRYARYIGDSTVKLELAAFAANGLSSGVETPTQFDVANINGFRQFDDFNDEIAFGGRVGFTNPIQGWTIGLSGLQNNAYDNQGDFDLSLWDVDLNYHSGNIDLRFEYAKVDQESPFGDIERQGAYVQGAYRNRNSTQPLLGRLEYVFRYGYVDFDGIDLAATGTDFGSRELTPVNRNRYTIGINNYITPSLIFKVAYEINDEKDSAFEVDDNGVIAQAVFGF